MYSTTDFRKGLKIEVEGIPYEIRRTDIGPVVFDYRKEPNPCALCARSGRAHV